MKKGFGVTHLTPKQRVNDILKTDYFLKNRGYEDYVVRNHNRIINDHIGAEYDLKCQREELFLPCDDREVASYDINFTPRGKPIYTLFNQSRGFWKLRVIRSSVNDLTDFTISVLVGNKWRYYPPTIKKHIVKEFGIDTYSQWRSTVLDDLDNLKKLVDSVDFSDYAYSVVCSASSERLCRRVGIEVKHQLAFLLPNK